jgi:hypothetical protein
MECLPFWPTYIGEKERTLGKTYGIIMKCYLEHPWRTHWEPKEHIGNLMETNGNLKEHIRNMLGTKEKNEKKPPTWTQLGLPHLSITGIF